jgi:hypothetical protein
MQLCGGGKVLLELWRCMGHTQEDMIHSCSRNSVILATASTTLVLGRSERWDFGVRITKIFVHGINLDWIRTHSGGRFRMLLFYRFCRRPNWICKA